MKDKVRKRKYVRQAHQLNIAVSGTGVSNQNASTPEDDISEVCDYNGNTNVRQGICMLLFTKQVRAEAVYET